MSQPLLALIPRDAPEHPFQNLLDVARSIHQHLLRQGVISRQALQKLMTQRFGGTDASGAWSMRDAYEALEAAQVLLLRDEDCRHLSGETPLDRFHSLLTLERSLPTQTYRSERQVDLQQFSTPLTLAWLAGLAAAIDKTDRVLEPSAGTGLLAVHATRAGASFILNERDPQRAALLGEALDQTVTGHDGELIDDLLPPDARPTVILINPPFSRSASRGHDRHAGARHLRSALLRLQPGGRCVAIMSPGFARANTGGPGYEAVCEIATPRVEIDIEGSPYVKHGTSINVRLLVFDKGWTGVTKHHRAADLTAALPLVLALPPRLSLDQPPPAPMAAAIKPRLPIRAPSSGLLRDVAAKALTAPAPIAPLPSTIVPLAYHVRDEIRPAGEASGIYAPWRLARIDIDGANPHPDALVESLAMASVPPPAPRYRPMLPDRAVRALSDAQLEVIIQAGDAFERDLPGHFRANDAGDRLIEDETGAAYRTGFYIGDGTGVGKGREAAGCIMDQWCQGRRKAVYLSKSSALEVEAKRDWTALGGLSVDIQGLDVFPLGKPIAMPSGILFCTYATLRSQRHDEASRLQQILDWLGEDFDGIIVIDEAHALANAAGTETQFGAAKGSEQGLAGVRLQNALPRARILYLSATGATDPANLCYAARLGLWGPRTAFPDRNAFMAAMDEGGIAAMEIVARDLKAMGLYTARALSFAGVEYEALEHQLTADQIDIYDAFADSWHHPPKSRRGVESVWYRRPHVRRRAQCSGAQFGPQPLRKLETALLLGLARGAQDADPHQSNRGRTRARSCRRRPACHHCGSDPRSTPCRPFRRRTRQPGP